MIPYRPDAKPTVSKHRRNNESLFVFRDALNPDPDPARYPVDFVDPVWIWIRPDPKSLDPDPARSLVGSGWILVLY